MGRRENSQPCGCSTGGKEKQREPRRTPTRSPLPKSVSLWSRAPTWLGREPALSWGSGGGERLLSPAPGWTGALYRGGQGDLQLRELSSINLSVPLT